MAANSVVKTEPPFSKPLARLKVNLRGAVQGVGFRPFVFRLASELGLKGWVKNSAQGVFIEAEGQEPALQQFRLRLEADKPPRSFIQSLEASWLDPVGYTHFAVLESDPGGPKTALVLPDIATCPDCRREIFDPANRRFFYPFTNCTNCGPRFTIIERLPYDRRNTSMKTFRMCPQCQAEYDDPQDRRFHAQPNACPICGPHLELWDSKGNVLAGAAPSPSPGTATSPANEALLNQTAEAITAGKIVAVKGLGGFHLIAAAHDEAAVRTLRERKHRDEKPFALMFPSLDSIRNHCRLSPLEERLLRSPEAPITLLHRAAQAQRGERPLPAVIAPGNPYLGAMLPYTPLHHLLLSILRYPVVATSGNLSDEPICIDEREALERLGGIADLLLVHNRPILRHVDDSIARIAAGRELLLRRARGFAPLPVPLTGRGEHAPAILGVGAHLKNTVSLAVGEQAFLSQHIGDLETALAFNAFTKVVADFQNLYETSPQMVAADAHPDYLSTKFARELCAAKSLQLDTVQHHQAHVFSCLAENQLQPPVLGVSWDGTGYGLDGSVWGGEFFAVSEAGVQRIAHWRRFRLPGGDQAIKEPRRVALGLLFELLGERLFNRAEVPWTPPFAPSELSLLSAMLERGLNSPLTSSVGRLFDGLASICGLHHKVRFEGQAAMALEFAAEECQTDEAYPIHFASAGQGSGTGKPPESQSLTLDWGPILEMVLHDLGEKMQVARISAKFHNTLAESILCVAEKAGISAVVLTGGCFQNKYLLERAIRRLNETGFRPYWHQRVPPNDGGIALGQVWGASRGLRSPSDAKLLSGG